MGQAAGKQPNNKPNYKKAGIVAAAFLGAVMIGGSMMQQNEAANDDRNPTYTEFLKDARAGKIDKVVLEGNTLKYGGELNKDDEKTVLLPPNTDIGAVLDDTKVDLEVREQGSSLGGMLVGFLPLIILLGLMIFVMRRMGSAVNNANSKAAEFGNSRAKLNTNEKKVTFDDVAGIEEAKGDLLEVVDFLKDPGRYQKMGAEIPKGVLLVGPPGTGKTLVARAVAGEANVPFFSISGSDFVEMFVGVGASRVRSMFTEAKKNAPCIIFIDEIDAVGRHRGAGLGGGNDEREQTLNQLLVEMDGFSGNSGVILIAATNRPDVLDPALLRPGRFNRHITVGLPDVEGRVKILRVHTRKKPMDMNIDLEKIARATPGFSGADLANLTNEAALAATRRHGTVVTMADFEEAKDKIIMGGARNSMVMSDEEKEITAYHEAGHAIISLFMKGSDPLHKVSIVPRGRALGVTVSLPERDRYSYRRDFIEALLTQLPAGRIAEAKLLGGYDKVTTGASNDIEKTTDLASRMVKEWGMSEKLGFMKYGDNSKEVFLGRSVTESKAMSEETARIVDQEIKRIIDEAYARADKILTDRWPELERLAKALLEYEELSAEEVKTVVAGGKIERQPQGPVVETPSPPAPQTPPPSPPPPQP